MLTKCQHPVITANTWKQKQPSLKEKVYRVKNNITVLFAKGLKFNYADDFSIFVISATLLKGLKSH